MTDKNQKILEIIKENKDVWKTTPEFFSWVRGRDQTRALGETPSKA